MAHVREELALRSTGCRCHFRHFVGAQDGERKLLVALQQLMRTLRHTSFQLIAAAL